jgi:hypothetical protein
MTKKSKPVEANESPAPAPQVGINVHYIGNDAVHRAAAITHVFDGGIVNLFVYPDGVREFEPVVRHVGHNEQMQPKTWHYIEQA